MASPTKSDSPAPSRTYRSLRAPNVKNRYSKHNSHRQSVNLKGCTLIRLPVELRNIIYDLTLPDEWDGKTPEIIAALRQFGVLYDEVMEAFHEKKYAFMLHAGNDWSFKNMDPKVIATIHSVKLVIT
jgi:hypothetical protein